jgi:hypothetical protein
VVNTELQNDSTHLPRDENVNRISKADERYGKQNNDKSQGIFIEIECGVLREEDGSDQLAFGCHTSGPNHQCCDLCGRTRNFSYFYHTGQS